MNEVGRGIVRERNCPGNMSEGRNVIHSCKKKIKRKRSDSGASGVVCTAYSRQDSRTAAVGGTVGAHAAAALNMS